MKQLSIGFLLTPFSEEEIGKDEYIEINPSRPWLYSIPSEWIIQKGDKQYVADDIAIYSYFKSLQLDAYYELKILYGNDTRLRQRIKECDIVFLLIFDRLEAFHTMLEHDYSIFAPQLTRQNIFPSSAYQTLINHKHLYYQHLQDRNVNVLPFLVLDKKDYKQNQGKWIHTLFSFPRGDEDKWVMKPILGQESIGVIIIEAYWTIHKIKKN